MKHPQIWNSVQTLIKFRNQAPSLTPQQSKNQIPLSFPQERLWTVAQLYPESSDLNGAYVFNLQGKLNILALEKSLKEIFQRHEILRTNFQLIDGQAVQIIDSVGKFKLEFVDLQEFSGKESKAIAIVNDAKHRPFSIGSDSLFRATLLKLETEEYLMVMTFHHIIWDTWSGGILFQELTKLYKAFCAGKTSPLPIPALQYSDFAIWQRQWLQEESLHSLQKFWQEQLHELPQQRLLIDCLPTATPTNSSKTQSLTFSKALTEDLNALAASEGVTLFIILLAAFKVLLRYYTDQEDLFVCTPIANRSHKDTQGLLGYFANLVIQRTNLSGEPTFLELLSRVCQGSSEAYAHQDLPIQKLVNHLDLTQIPLSQLLFSFEKNRQQNLELGDLKIAFLEEQTGSDFDLFLSVCNDGGELNATIKYKTDLFYEETISQMLQNFQAIIENITINPKQSINELLPSSRNSQKTIEIALKQHPNVEESIVFYQENIPGYKYLLAYIIFTEKQIPELQELRSFLKQKLPNQILPAAIFPIDAMPLKADGSIDYEALNSLNQVRQTLGKTYLPPNTRTEKKVAKIWTKVLWLDREIGINETFFDLGGHSLLAARLIAEIEIEFKRKVPLTMLSQFSTIEQLARILDKPIIEELTHPNKDSSSVQTQLSPEIYNQLLAYTSGWKGIKFATNSLIVGMNTAGTKQPLFFGLNTSNHLSQLAKYMGTDQPVYGMRSYSGIIEPQDYDKENIHALAAQYVSEILRLQPKGPYLLGGICQAAWMASEIAKQLVNQGKTVTLLCLMEKYTLQIYPGKVALLFRRESDSRFNPYQEFSNPELGWRKFFRGGFSVDMLPGYHGDGQNFREPYVQLTAEALSNRIEQAQTEIIPTKIPQNEYQLLPQEAYQAKLKLINSIRPLEVTTEESFVISVQVKNISPIMWKATKHSGIRLGNHWLDSNEKVIRYCDGVADINQDLLPGSEITLLLEITSPQKIGYYTLELDLVEEGVTWFKDQGSKTTIVDVKIISNNYSQDNPKIIIDSEENSSQFYINQGNFYYSRGNMEIAIFNYQKAISLMPEQSIEVYRNLGIALTHQDDLIEGINYYKKALELEPNTADIYFLIGQAETKQNNLSSAVINYYKAIELEPEHFWLYRDLGTVLNQLNRLEELVTVYSQVITLNTDNPEFYFQLGSAQIRLGDLENGVKNYQKAKDLNSDVPRYDRQMDKDYQILGDNFIQKGNYEAAILVYRRCLELNPDSPKYGIHLTLGKNLVQLNKIEEAITVYQQAIAKVPEKASAYKALGALQLKLECYQDAIASYEKAIELNPQQPLVIYKRLGDALITEGEIEKAISCYDKAFQLQPNNQSIRKKLENLKNISHKNPKIKANKINKNSGNSLSRKIPKNMIFFWDNKESAPEKVNQVIAKNTELNPDYNVIYADDDYMYKLIQDKYNQEILDLYRLNKIPASRSDIARLMLLYEYGGVYLDATIEVNKSINNIIGNEEEIVLVRRDDFPIYADVPEQAELMNGFIGVIPRCEFIREIIFKIINNLRYGKYNNLVGFATGPYNLYALWHQYELTYQISKLSCSQLKKDFLIDHQVPNISHSWFDQQKQGIIDKSYYAKHEKFWEYEKISLHDKQISGFNEILQSQPNDFYARIRLCQLNCKLGKSQEKNDDLELAIASYKKATELAPEYLLAHSFLGNAQFKCGNYQEAIFSYEKVIELDYRQSFSVYKRLGDALRKLEKIDKAIAIYQQAIKLFPEKPSPYIVLGHIQFESKNYPETITFYQKAINLNPEQPFIVYQRLGGALRKLQETDEAIAAYNEALKLRPDSQIVHRSLTKLKLEIQNGTTKFIDIGQRIKKQNRSNIILTGIPRSGTSLTCKLLNKLSNTVALVEPKPPKSLFNLGKNNLQQPQEHQRICQELESWIETMRTSLLTSKKVETRLINGQIPDNFASSYFGNTGKRLKKVCKMDELVIDKKLESDFKLCIKHNLWLTAIINKITSNFTTFGIIRNPLSVLASWNTVPFPVTDGHEPIAEQLNSQLAQELQGIDDKFERQIHLLFWCYKQFFSYLPDKNILRYEDLISSGGKSLQVIVPQASLLNESLTSKNNNPIYDKELITFLGHKLLEKEGYVWEFYSKQDVKNIINTSVLFDSSIETTKNNTAILKQNSDFLVPFEETIEACQEIISLQQNNYHAYFLLGNAQSNEGKHDEAISSYKKAIELAPDNFYYYRNLGDVFSKQNDLDNALVNYQQALEINPENHQVCLKIGNVLLQQNDMEGAIVQFQEAIRLNPDYAYSYILLGKALRAKDDLEAAIAPHQKAIELNPNNPSYYNILGNIQARLKNYDSAIACYRSSLELNPQQSKIYISLGNTLSKIDKTEKALLAYEEALELEPNNQTITDKLTRLRADQSVIKNQTLVSSIK